MSVWRRQRDDRSWRDADLTAIDFETTSGQPRHAKPLSVGWVTVREGRVRMSTAGYRVISYDGAVPPASIPIHRLMPAQIRAGTAAAAIADDLRSAAGRRPVIAHGGWIEREMLRRFDAGHTGLIDTMAIIRRLDGREGRIPRGMSLTAAARRFGVVSLRAHHAFGDALTTALLLVVIATRIERERGRCLVDDLVRLGRI